MSRSSLSVLPPPDAEDCGAAAGALRDGAASVVAKTQFPLPALSTSSEICGWSRTKRPIAISPWSSGSTCSRTSSFLIRTMSGSCAPGALAKATSLGLDRKLRQDGECDRPRDLEIAAGRLLDESYQSRLVGIGRDEERGRDRDNDDEDDQTAEDDEQFLHSHPHFCCRHGRSWQISRSISRSICCRTATRADYPPHRRHGIGD